MLAPGVGFHSKDIFISGSSGTGYATYSTVNEWTNHAHLGNVIWVDVFPEVSEMTRASVGGMFYVNELYPYVKAVSYLSVEANNLSGQTGNSNVVGPLAVVSDTICYWTTIGALPSYLPHVITVMRSHAHMASGEQPEFLATLPVLAACRPSLSFRDTVNGVLVIQDTSLTTHVLVSHDGGYEWDFRHSLAGNYLRDLSYLDDMTIWGVGDDGLAIRSINGVEVWQEVALPVSEDLWSVRGYSADSIWISGSNGLVMVSGDAGDSWTDRSIQATTIERIQPLDGVVYAYSANGGLFRYDPMVQVNEPISEQWDCWIPVVNGMALRLRTGERLTGFELFDAAGRPLSVPITGATCDMRRLTAGLYVARLMSSQRRVNWKFYWPGTNQR